MRILASVSVVTAHCVHLWVERFSVSFEYASLGFLAAVLDQLSRFTLPVFFFLSGFGLTLQAFDRPIRLGDYYRFRLLKILAPFLLWTAITSFRHLFWIESWDWAQRPLANFAYLLRFIFIDGVDYQYYFLIVIFQFYLIFPFIFKLGKYRWAGLVALFLHFCVTSPIETFLEMANSRLPHLHSNILLPHFFWCFMGVFVAWNREGLARWAQSWSLRASTLFWILSFGMLNFEFFYNLKQGKLLSDIDHFNRWSVVVYGLASFLLFLKIKPWLTPRIIQNPRAKILFSHVAPYTFFVYLVHTHVLRSVDFLSSEATLTDFVMRIFWVLAGSYGLAWAAHWLLEDFPKLRFALGLPKQPLKLREVPGLRRLWSRFADQPHTASQTSSPLMYSRDES
jgi:probable poly-beta-1,6-N-acetyl-D-glucosamine export protein